ncbi:hypothetical protein CRG98_043615, partial [Punica granatum]
MQVQLIKLTLLPALISHNPIRKHGKWQHCKQLGCQKYKTPDLPLHLVEDISRDPICHEHDQSVGNEGDQPILALPIPRVETGEDLRSNEGGPLVPTRSSQGLSHDVDDFDIAWDDLKMGERIGAGSFGTVCRAIWQGVDVAVKILVEVDFRAEQYKEFLTEFLRE